MLDEEPTLIEQALCLTGSPLEKGRHSAIVRQIAVFEHHQEHCFSVLGCLLLAFKSDAPHPSPPCQQDHFGLSNPEFSHLQEQFLYKRQDGICTEGHFPAQAGITAVKVLNMGIALNGYLSLFDQPGSPLLHVGMCFPPFTRGKNVLVLHGDVLPKCRHFGINHRFSPVWRVRNFVGGQCTC